jgi:trimeric autotransporter adhesin
MLARLLSRRPSHTTIVAYLALFFAMGGTAYAVNEWTGANIVDGSLTNADLASETIRSGKIKNGNVAAQDLAIDSVTATAIADNAIDGGEIVNNSLTASDLGDASVGTSEIINSTIVGADVANGSLTMVDLRGADNNGAISLAAGSVSNGTCQNFEANIPGVRGR